MNNYSDYEIIYYLLITHVLHIYNACIKNLRIIHFEVYVFKKNHTALFEILTLFVFFCLPSLPF